MIVIEQEEIIEISAHFFCRRHRCKYVKIIPVRECRKYTRKHVSLYIGGHVKFGTDTLLLGSDRDKVFKIPAHLAVHLIECSRQFFKFIPGVYIYLDMLIIIEVTDHLLCGGIDLQYRVDDIQTHGFKPCPHREEQHNNNAYEQDKDIPEQIHEQSIHIHINADKRNRFA